MSAKPRCRLCKHRPRRIVSATVQTRGGTMVEEPRVRKKPCACECHRRVKTDE